ncbi:MAG: Putative toxin subunit [uncultured Paraburkholderia sp.]|nr:MAG: Putative toxin subunit [uncultured Paraburkholderia sp.]
MAGFALPLPVSAGRGYAPSLTLNYSSGAGNGPFGLGWQLSSAAIRRRTNRGVPRYDGGPDDEFIHTSGEVLVSERDERGETITTSVTQYGDKDLGKTYQVTRYFRRVENAFDRIERWQGSDDDFWMIHGADGQLHCFGKTAAARVANPDASEQIAEWYIEESVSPSGEHIYFRYVAETADGVAAENEENRDHAANRYLAEVYYGNRTPAPHLYLWDTTHVRDQGWLFSVVLDYGERGIDFDTPAPYGAPSGHVWAMRADSFSRYQYGFEVRTRRLCRQALLFHHIPEQLSDDHTLIRRMLFTYGESPAVTHLTQARSLAYGPDGALQNLPPIEFGYSTFDPSVLAGSGTVFDGVPELRNGEHYELVDLYGDGLPGVLFRHDVDWRYKPPMRGKAGTEAVAYGAWQALPSAPAMQPAQLALMDIDGDGRMDWLVT